MILGLGLRTLALDFAWIRSTGTVSSSVHVPSCLTLAHSCQKPVFEFISIVVEGGGQSVVLEVLSIHATCIVFTNIF